MKPQELDYQHFTALMEDRCFQHLHNMKAEVMSAAAQRILVEIEKDILDVFKPQYVGITRIGELFIMDRSLAVAFDDLIAFERIYRMM